MKIIASLVVSCLLSIAVTPVFAGTTVLNDTFTASNVNNGFNPGEGVNSGITSTNTRLTGAFASNLRYIKKGNKNDSAYTISGNKCNITSGLQSGRFTVCDFSSTNAFDFSGILGTTTATPANPVIYDLTIAMNNKVNVSNPSNTLGRMSFAWGCVEGGGGNWNFGLQIQPQTNGTYNVYKRIKASATGLASEQNVVITNTGTAGNEISFVVRVTDAGAESASYSSRVQVSLDDGATWFYDTQTDGALVNGFRFDLATRYVSFDQAANDGADTYDNFSITFDPNLTWTGGGSDANWSTGINWLRDLGTDHFLRNAGILTNGNEIAVFAGTTRQATTNDLIGLQVASLAFNNDGFALFGNPVSINTGITNVAGTNVVNNDVVLVANSRFQTVGSITYNGGISSTGRNLTVGGAGSTVINGAIALGTGTLTKTTTAGSLTLNGTNTYTNTTSVSQGLLSVNGSIASANTTISSAGILGGTGTVSGPVNVTGSLAAGNGIGKLTTGALTLNNNGSDVFEISSVSGTPGIKWDFVDAGANNVTVSATNTAPFKVILISAGLNDFNKDATYSWPAIGGAVQNFSADRFTVNTSSFTNDISGGLFSVESTGTSLNVRFVNNHGPTAAATNVTFAAGVPFQILIADLLTNLTSDPDGDARSLVSVISTNATVTTNGTNITILSTNSSVESIAYVVKDARTYRANDTVRMATNYINIVVTNAPSGGGVFVITNNNGTINLGFSGTAGSSYVIQRSPDLSSWVNVSTNAADGNGTIQFSEVPPYTPAFYRSLLQ